MDFPKEVKEVKRRVQELEKKVHASEVRPQSHQVLQV
jgi:hypothetical protein